MPLRADRVINRLRDIRGGRLDDSRFCERMRGRGPYWESICSLFAVSKERYGLNGGCEPEPAPAELYKAGSPRKVQLAFDCNSAENVDMSF